MSLYHEAAQLLTTSEGAGNLKSRIFGRKDLKSSAGQIYALAVESCKWSHVLKEVLENTELLRLERKLTPILCLLLVHDLLLAKGGIALPVTHGLRSAVDRHKGRLQAEFTKARIRRKLSTFEALKLHVDNGLEDASNASELLHPRWIRINTLRTTLEEQLDSTFTGYDKVETVNSVRQRGFKRIYIDVHIPNLLAISSNIDLSRSDAYKSGQIIFQDKASCFPAYLLDPLPTDGDIIDACSAPGNKTTHLAAILIGHSRSADQCSQKIHAFEWTKSRALTLEKMVNIAGSQNSVSLHAGQDFLRADPDSPAYENVGALLLDPSCSGSGIVGRDEMPMLHLPVLQTVAVKPTKGFKKNLKENVSVSTTRKRKLNEDTREVMIDDDGALTTLDSDEQVKTRLAALSAFQLRLLLHAFKFPAARKITYSTCSVHAEENEMVVRKALASDIAQIRGWRFLKRNEQIKGMRDWPVRGDLDACDHDSALAEACIRTNKADSHGTMGFFVAGFVRNPHLPEDIDSLLLRNEQDHPARYYMSIPLKKQPAASRSMAEDEIQDEAEEWNGFADVMAERRMFPIEQPDNIAVPSKALFKKVKRRKQ